MKDVRYAATILLLIAITFVTQAQESESTKPVKTAVTQSEDALKAVKKKVNDAEKKANKKKKKAKKTEKEAKKKEKKEKLKKDIESNEKEIEKYKNQLVKLSDKMEKGKAKGKLAPVDIQKIDDKIRKLNIRIAKS